MLVDLYMKIGKFETEYKRLNPNQKKAVDTVEGTVMVVAGPGTGKTQILSLRIANILKKTDTEPENILALTFTNAGVYSMRKRLAEIIGSEAYRVYIFTFHSFFFCNFLTF
jgi:DNA helicase-2/ATP-dependent DNA helicase PcrA